MDTSNLRKNPYVYAVSGYKNSGKTTMIIRLIKELTSRGYKVAVIKHDGHDFESDVPGTDSWKHQKAGAYGTAVFSQNRLLITKECTGICEKELMKAFPEADIIIIEGLKYSHYPKYICQYPKEALKSPKELADEIEHGMKGAQKWE
ncbi:MAG: molybdopterin-guanine dinucleotide biosynthesis protein B [Lachnospiraceae bacterium]|nr:molybdopterin-guanine dinucleotide biosynthesis protein B [Lachnospiraceae bacterium]